MSASSCRLLFRRPCTTPWPLHSSTTSVIYHPSHKDVISARREPGKHRHSVRVRSTAGAWNSLQQAARLATSSLDSVQRALSGLPAGFPPGPPGNAAVGMLADPLTFLEDTQHRYGKIAGLRLGPEAVVLISDRKAARQIMVEQSASFAKEGTAFFPGSRLAGNGLLVSDGATWRRQRQLSNPAFRQAAVAVYSQAMAAAAQKLVREKWAAKRATDVYADYNALTLDIVTEVLFGWDIPKAQADTIVGAIKAAFEYFANQAGIGIPEWVPTPGGRQYMAAVQALDTVVYRIIDERRLALDSGQRSAQCLLDNLVMARDDSGQSMTSTALRDELMTLLVAGQETSAVLLAWCTAFLAYCPHVQARAAAEVAQVLQGEAPSSSNIRKLPYLEMVLLEVLRLRPPAFLVGRCCNRDVQVQSHFLPKGTTFLISPYLMHRDASLWHRPLTFDPDRWRDIKPDKPLGSLDLLQGLGHNGSYLPFGAGPRNCIGTGFAVTEAMVVLATALQAFTFSPQSTQFPQAAARITLRPQPVHLSLRARR